MRRRPVAEKGSQQRGRHCTQSPRSPGHVVLRTVATDGHCPGPRAPHRLVPPGPIGRTPAPKVQPHKPAQRNQHRWTHCLRRRTAGVPQGIGPPPPERDSRNGCCDPAAALTDDMQYVSPNHCSTTTPGVSLPVPHPEGSGLCEYVALCHAPVSGARSCHIQHSVGTSRTLHQSTGPGSMTSHVTQQALVAGLGPLNGAPGRF